MCYITEISTKVLHAIAPVGGFVAKCYTQLNLQNSPNEGESQLSGANFNAFKLFNSMYANPPMPVYFEEAIL